MPTSHPWNPTPEQRAAAVAKGIATRRRNREARLAVQAEIDSRKAEILALDKELHQLRERNELCGLSRSLSGQALLNEKEIVASASLYEATCGVYFLVRADRVVYVGQSTNVFGRLPQHASKEFDSVAWIACSRNQLDILESLYIHFLRPPLNGNQQNGSKQAPWSIGLLLAKAEALAKVGT